jgi:hypothetical protein
MSFLKSLFGSDAPEEREPEKQFTVVEGSDAYTLVVVLLFRAQEDQATEFVIGPSSGADTPMRYKIGDSWRDLPPFPARIRRDVVAELGRIARLPTGRFPNRGVLDLRFGESRLSWTISMASADGECVLVRFQDR